jgi:two-component system LytT family response regulator
MSGPLRCLLIDDEPLALKRLEMLLADHPEVEIIGKISRPSEAVAQIDSLQPDLVFLDIQMPGMNGFEVLERVRRQPMVVFVTAYDRYALEAFEVNSIDYLLKPVDRQRLQKAISKLVQLRGQAADALNADVERLLEFVRQRAGNAPRRLVSRHGDRMVLIEPSEIAYFHAESKYTFAVTARGEHILDYTLQQLREWLPADKFLNIHRSYIVNLDWIAELARGFGGGMLCRLKSPISKDLPISRAQVQQVRERIQF